MFMKMFRFLLAYKDLIEGGLRLCVDGRDRQWSAAKIVPVGPDQPTLILILTLNTYTNTNNYTNTHTHTMRYAAIPM